MSSMTRYANDWTQGHPSYDRLGAQQALAPPQSSGGPGLTRVSCPVCPASTTYQFLQTLPGTRSTLPASFFRTTFNRGETEGPVSRLTHWYAPGIGRPQLAVSPYADLSLSFANANPDISQDSDSLSEDEEDPDAPYIPDRSGIPYVDVSLPVSVARVVEKNERVPVLSMLAAASVVPQAMDAGVDHSILAEGYKNLSSTRHPPYRARGDQAAYSALVETTFRAMSGEGVDDGEVSNLSSRMRRESILFKTEHGPEGAGPIYTEVTVIGLSEGSPYMGQIHWVDDWGRPVKA